MQRKNILISILMTLILILFAVFLYGFTYHTINKRFFDASVTHTIETMQVMRDLGIQKVEHNLRDLKTNLQNTASQNSNQLVKGTYNERVTILSQLQLPQDGIDYWYCTPQGKVVTAKGLILDWKLKTDLNAVFSSGETVVIDPYFDESGNYILSIAAPLRQNGQVVALLLVRLNGYCISKWIEDIQFQTGEGLAYIISGDGRNIATSRKKNYDWITSEYNSLELMDADKESKSVADLERLPLEGKTGWGTYQWEGFTNYLVYGPMEETNWGFFVGFYGDTLSQYIQKIASNSTASSQLFILTLFVLLAILAVYTNYNLRKEKSYTKELLRQKQEIQQQAEELAISEERFRIALERTSNIIFEYNFQTGNITNFRRTKEVVHYETSCKHLKDCLVLEGVIDDESVRLLEHSLHDILDGMPKSECVIKAFLADGTIVWYRVSITSVSNQGQQPTRVIGILEDITKEKLAELDPLTGVFNKKVLTEQILACLQQMGKMIFMPF